MHHLRLIRDSFCCVGRKVNVAFFVATGCKQRITSIVLQSNARVEDKTLRERERPLIQPQCQGARNRLQMMIVTHLHVKRRAFLILSIESKKNKFS